MPQQVDVSALVPAFGAGPTDQPIVNILDRVGAGDTQSHITTFPDGSFHNYYSRGLSFFYTKVKDDEKHEALDRIDFYNPAREGEAGPSRRRTKPTTYQPSPDLIFRFPSTTLPIPARPAPDPSLPMPKKRTVTAQPTTIERPASLTVDRHTTAKTLVECFGEPKQKGGQVGWLDTYMEWEVEVVDQGGAVRKIGVMVELREGGGEGISVWDRAGGWEWACLKVFLPVGKRAS